jgi:ribosome-associated translation inhibitor RaiA
MDRSLQIVFRDIDHSATLARLIQDRVQRLEHFYAHIIGCRVVAAASYRGQRKAKMPLAISVEVEVPGRPLIVARSEAKRAGEYGGAVSRVFEAVQRQLRQFAAILKGNVKRHENALDTGVVVRLFPEQNYGFVEVKGAPDLYFTRNAVIKGDFAAVRLGAMVRVARAATEGVMGPQASSIGLIEKRAGVRRGRGKNAGTSWSLA